METKISQTMSMVGTGCQKDSKPPEFGEWDVGHDEYHADRTADSSSTISKFIQSPEAYYSHYVEEGKDHEPSRAMIFGSAFHTMLLEPREFSARYAIVPTTFQIGGDDVKIDKRKKLHRELWSQWEEESEDREVLSSDEVQSMKQMVQSIKNDARVMALLQTPGLKTEQAIRFECRGRPLKCMFDLVWPEAGIFANLKTSREWGRDKAGGNHIGRTIYNWGYHIAAALYCEGFEQVYGTKGTPKFIWAHNQPEWECALLTLGDSSVEVGREVLNDTLDNLSAAKALDWFRSCEYEQDTLIEIPEWAIRRRK